MRAAVWAISEAVEDLRTLAGGAAAWEQAEHERVAGLATGALVALAEHLGEPADA